MKTVTALKLSESHYKSIKDHVDGTPDVEVCGLIGGVWQPYDRLALARVVIPVKNVDPAPSVRYAMEPQALLNAVLNFEKKGWEVVGIYHSHPHGTAQPSVTDAAEAMYPDAVYLIGVPGGNLTAWRIIRGEIHAAALEIVDEN